MFHQEDRNFQDRCLLQTYTVLVPEVNIFDGTSLCNSVLLGYISQRKITIQIRYGWKTFQI